MACLWEPPRKYTFNHMPSLQAIDEVFLLTITKRNKVFIGLKPRINMRRNHTRSDPSLGTNHETYIYYCNHQVCAWICINMRLWISPKDSWLVEIQGTCVTRLTISHKATIKGIFYVRALCGRKPKTSLFIVNHKDIEFELSLTYYIYNLLKYKVIPDL